jgi:hypothetical protein
MHSKSMCHLFFLLFAFISPVFLANIQQRFETDLFVLESQFSSDQSFASQIKQATEAIVSMKDTLQKTDHLLSDKTLLKRLVEGLNSALSTSEIILNSSSTDLLAGLHNLVREIFYLRPILGPHMMDNYESFEFLKRCLNLLFTYGIPSVEVNSLRSVEDDQSLLPILEYIGTFMASNQTVLDAGFISRTFLYYASCASQLNLLEEMVMTDLPFESLKFMHSKRPTSCVNDFILWNRIFFSKLHIIYENRADDPNNVKMLLELAKLIDQERDIDWVIGIFSAANIAECIYSRQNLFMIIAGNLKKFITIYTERFNSCLDSLGSVNSQRLLKMMTETELKRQQISVTLKTQALAQSVVDNSILSDEASYLKLELLLEQINEIELKVVKKEHSIQIAKILKEQFINLYSKYISNRLDGYLAVINAFIPILLKLEGFDSQSLEMARSVSRLMSAYLADHSESIKQIDLCDIRFYLEKFHGEILHKSEVPFFFSIMIKNWNISLDHFRPMMMTIDRMGWYRDEIAIEHTQQRILKYLKSPRKSREDLEHLNEFIDFLVSERKCLSKTEEALMREAIQQK